MATEILEVQVQSNIKGVTDDVDDLGKSLKDTTKQTEQLKPATEAGAKGFRKVGLAVRALGTAIKAIGIGLIISGFMALKQAFMQNQVAADLMTKTAHFIGIVFNEVVNIVIRLAQWVGENSKKFDAWKKVMMGFINLGWLPFKLAVQTTELSLRLFGNAIMTIMNLFGQKNTRRMNENRKAIKALGRAVKKTANGMVRAGKDIKENWGEANDAVNEFLNVAGKEFSDMDFKKYAELATKLTELGKAAKLAAVDNETAAAKDKKAAELQRQIRDDVSRSIEERMDANKKLGELLKEQLKRRKAALLLAQEEAQTQFNINASDENKIALGMAYVEVLKLEEEMTGQLSEQLTNKIALEDELAENKKTLMEATTEQVKLEKLEIENWEEEMLKLAKRTFKEKADLEAMEVKIKAEATRQKKLLVQDQLNAELQAYAKLAGALSQLAGDNKELAIAEAVISMWTGATKALETPIYGWVEAAAIIAAGLSNIRKIMETKVPGGGGGGGGMPSMVTPQPPSPQMMSGAFTLGGGADPEPARAYVVSDDITNNQNKLAIIRRRATI